MTCVSHRGHKTVGRFMPNEVALLGPVINALQDFITRVDLAAPSPCLHAVIGAFLKCSRQGV